jgi:hypothetical protein
LLAKKTLPDIGKYLLTALSKSKLCAFWVPESAKILVDTEVPKLKHRWIEGHEIAHSITPWHKEFLLGDNTQTLDPACHAMLEAEANYGAARLLFMQDRFAAEARDLELSFESIMALATRYENSIISTLWRTVEDRDPSQPVFGMISVHPRYRDIGKHDGPNPWRYFIRSAAFSTQFSGVSPEKAFELIVRHSNRRRTGPVLSARGVLQDVISEDWEFQVESFATKHAFMTFGFAIRRHPPTVQVSGGP